MEAQQTLGRRKAAIARVTLKKGKGNITINGKDHAEYIPVTHLRLKLEEPLLILDLVNAFDISVKVNGGGVKGQVEAIRLGICRALCEVNAEYRPPLKAKGFMTRDARIVERKKPGFRKARKKEQYSKR